MVVEYPERTFSSGRVRPLPQYHPFVPIIFGVDGIWEEKNSYEDAKKRQDLTNALLRSSAQERIKAADAARALDKRFEKRIRTALGDKAKLKKAVEQCTADFHKHEEDLAKRLGMQNNNLTRFHTSIFLSIPSDSLLFSHPGVSSVTNKHASYAVNKY